MKEGDTLKTDRKRPQKEKKKKRIPTTVMESIPYRSVYKNGIIEDYDGRFSKTYRLKNTNFDVEEIEKQDTERLDSTIAYIQNIKDGWLLL